MERELVTAAAKVADWLEHVQITYHLVIQRATADDRDTCEAGMCGDYRKYRDLLRTAIRSEVENTS